MSLKGNSKKPLHLSLVEGENSTQLNSAAEVVTGFESLSTEQQNTARRYLELSNTNSNAMLVGAIVGPSFWDLRPVIFEDGNLQIIRTTDPALFIERNRYAQFRSLIARIFACQDSYAISFGEAQGQIWVRRKFYQSTLQNDKQDLLNLSESIHACQEIIAALDALHSSGLVHGHICLSNIGIERGDKPTLIDFGYAFSKPIGHALEINSHDLAPEIANGQLPDIRSDIYGLGLVLKKLMGTHIPTELKSFVEQMLAKDPNQRPSMQRIKELFGLRQQESNLLLNNSKPEQIYVAPSNLPPAKLIESKVYEEPIAQVKPKIDLNLNFAGLKPLTIGAFILITLLVVVVSKLVFSSNNTNPEFETSADIDFSTYWLSSQTSLMRQVAHAALKEESSTEAQLAIVAAALNGKEISRVRSNIIRIAFNPIWEAELSQTDRKLAIALALANLYPEGLKRLPSMKDAHPSVVLAIASELELNSSNEMLKLPISKMFSLEAPYGDAYSALSKFGIKQVNQVESIILAHILTGTATEAQINQFVDSADFKRLGLLIGLAPTIKGFDHVLYQALSNNPIFAAQMNWFSTEKIAEWDKLPKLQRLLLVCGVFSDKENKLSTEQYADLLSFPKQQIRTQALTFLSNIKNSNLDESTLNFIALAANKNYLTRFQTISLVSALLMEGKEALSFISAWFNLKPNAKLVLELLILRGSRIGIDRNQQDNFNLEATRYLIKVKDLSPNLDQFKKLSLHPEPLARALAYSKLDLNDPAQLEVLKSMAFVEPIAKLRQAIKDRLLNLEREKLTIDPEAANSAKSETPQESNLDEEQEAIRFNN